MTNEITNDERAMIDDAIANNDVMHVDATHAKIKSKKSTTTKRTKTSNTTKRATTTTTNTKTLSINDIASMFNMNAKTLRARIRRNKSKFEKLYVRDEQTNKYVFRNNKTTTNAIEKLLKHANA